MNQKAFTMIELLAIFTITAILLLITVPKIVGNIKKGHESAYAKFEENVFIATEAYIQEENMPITEETTIITIEELIRSGYLRDNLINPNNSEKLSSTKNKKLKITVKKDFDGILQYEMEREK